MWETFVDVTISDDNTFWKSVKVEYDHTHSITFAVCAYFIKEYHGNHFFPSETIQEVKIWDEQADASLNRFDALNYAIKLTNFYLYEREFPVIDLQDYH